MKRAHHDLTARVFQAMASPTRLRAVSLLAQGPWNVGQLADELEETVATTSAHLKVLRASHLVEVEKKGREVWCRVSSPQVIAALAAAQQAAAAVLPEFRELVKENDEDPLLAADMDLRDLADMVSAGRLTLIDLRPASEYQAGHLPEAKSYPLSILSEADLTEFRTYHPVIGYCRGPFCKNAREGVRLLNEKGVPARRLCGGVIEWQAAGLPLER